MSTLLPLDGYANSVEGQNILRKAHFQRAVRLIGPLVFAWGIATIIASRLSGIREGPFESFDIVGALLCGVTIGSVMAWFETRPLRPGFLNRYPWLDVVMRAVLYTAAVFVTMVLGRCMLFSLFPDEVRCLVDTSDAYDELTGHTSWGRVSLLGHLR